jgi:hypothetical protein
MCKNPEKYKSCIVSLMIVAFLCLGNIAYPQYIAKNDTLKKIPPEVINKISNLISVFSKQALLSMPASIVPASVPADKNILFFDSLKVKASRNQLTKRLYSFVIVRRDTIYKKHFTGTSDANYIQYSGKKIRKIVIQRLNVFGADINNPASTDATKFENILNKTHVSTNESIIRKNLLFSEGDVITPLTLSDNERLLRQLPYIDDARIIVLPVSDDEADIVVYTKDVYSLGGSYTYHGLKKGSVSVFEKNIFGMGQEFGLDMPFDNTLPDSPGFGVHYLANNISKSFINLNVYFLHGLGEKTYGFDLSRKLISSTTKYAGK